MTKKRRIEITIETHTFTREYRAGAQEAGSGDESRAITSEEAEALGIDIRELARELFAMRDHEQEQMLSSGPSNTEDDPDRPRSNATGDRPV